VPDDVLAATLTQAVGMFASSLQRERKARVPGGAIV
jgi:hypothetical protein